MKTRRNKARAKRAKIDLRDDRPVKWICGCSSCDEIEVSKEAEKPVKCWLCSHPYTDSNISPATQNFKEKTNGKC